MCVKYFCLVDVVVETSTADSDDFAIYGIANPIIFEHYRQYQKIEICAVEDDSDDESDELLTLDLQPDGEGLDDQIGLPNKANVLILSENSKFGMG